MVLFLLPVQGSEGETWPASQGSPSPSRATRFYWVDACDQGCDEALILPRLVEPSPHVSQPKTR